MNPNHTKFLTIDVGNTSTLMGVFQHDQLTSTVRLPTLKASTAQEWHINLQASVQKLGLQSPISIIGTSVVPEANVRIADFFAQHLQTKCRWITHKDHFNFTLNIEQPETIGTDRLVDAHAATAMFGQSVIVVDMGTATTVDCVLNGVFEGGLILPGLEISAQALFDKTSKLFPVTLEKPKSFLGKSTHDCIQSGLVNGYALMLDGIIQKIRKNVSAELKVISTGGLSKLMMNVSETMQLYDEFLTLRGLFALRN